MCHRHSFKMRVVLCVTRAPNLCLTKSQPTVSALPFMALGLQNNVFSPAFPVFKGFYVLAITWARSCLLLSCKRHRGKERKGKRRILNAAPSILPILWRRRGRLTHLLLVEEEVVEHDDAGNKGSPLEAVLVLALRELEGEVISLGQLSLAAAVEDTGDRADRGSHLGIRRVVDLKVETRALAARKEAEVGRLQAAAFHAIPESTILACDRRADRAHVVAAVADLSSVNIEPVSTQRPGALNRGEATESVVLHEQLGPVKAQASAEERTAQNEGVRGREDIVSVGESGVVRRNHWGGRHHAHVECAPRAAELSLAALALLLEYKHLGTLSSLGFVKITVGVPSIRIKSVLLLEVCHRLKKLHLLFHVEARRLLHNNKRIKGEENDSPVLEPRGEATNDERKLTAKAVRVSGKAAPCTTWTT
jgi:hypothetical protein